MPIEKTIKLFRYNELSERAKERAREWYLSGIYWPDEMASTIELWRELAEKLGFEVESGPWWDLYRHSFEIGRGSFLRPDDDDLDALAKEWGEEATDVHTLISEVRAIRPYMSASISDGRVHDVSGGEDHLEEPDVDYPDEEWNVYYDRVEEIEKEERSNIEEALLSLQHLGLKWLQDEEEYLESEEQVAEAMEANEWLFHEDGSFARY